MSTLFRFIPRPGAAIDPRQDCLLSGERIIIGRAPDCDLILRRPGIRYRHAELAVAGNELRLAALADAALGPKTEPVQDAVLAAIGDRIHLGPYLLELAEAEPDSGANHVVVCTCDDAAAIDEPSRAANYVRAYAVVLPNIRLWSFSLALLLIGAGLLLPLMNAPIAPEISWSTPAGRTPEQLNQTRFPSFWMVGEFSSGHRAFADNCATCHVDHFTLIDSETCLSCHRGIGQHASPIRAPEADLRKRRCGDCHHEHMGETLATLGDQKDCVACHGEIKEWAPETTLVDIHDFGKDHPQFKPSLIDDPVKKTLKRFALGDKTAQDHSGLRYTHAAHFRLYNVPAAGVAGGTCGQCHEPAPGGMVFKPVQFESKCASCHKLQFEPRHPEWSLPHGQRDDIVSRVKGFYAEAQLAGERFTPPSPDLFRQPGHLPLPRAVSATEAVSAETAATMMAAIANSACGECHTVTPPAAGEAATEWHLQPVVVSDRYLVKGRFKHDRHSTILCQDCHAATTSDGGVMQLLPGVEVCKTCHSGEVEVSHRVPTTCTTCHAFHDSDHPLLRPRGGHAMTAVPGALTLSWTGGVNGK
jgi:hypothetical protein